jgi:hypothetical protein
VQTTAAGFRRHPREHIMEWIAFDTNFDGWVDELYVDTNYDGYYDTAVYDWNYDGSFDEAFVI